MNLKTLSEKLNLSQTTVSRALNGYPEVKEKTRKRVLEAAEKYNYRANPTAKSLATGRSMAIGHVLLIDHQEIGNPIAADFFEGAGQVYSQAGYHMAVTVVTKENEEKVYRELAARKSVDGVVVHGPCMPDERIELLQELKLPFIVHGRAQETEQKYSWLDVNNQSAFKKATDLLLDLGHERIALLNGIEPMAFAVRRRAGYEAALNERDIEIDPEIMFSNQMVEPYGYEKALKLLKSDNPPTAFLVSSIIPAIGVQRAISEMGLEMGKDVSVVTHDDQLSFLPIGGSDPLFTSTRSSVREAGKFCAESLLAKINDPNKGIVQELWDASLIIGKSTGMRRG